MLYVFRMDVGQMMTFEISLLMDTVSRLQIEIAKATGIPVEKQILLVSGGHSLKPDQKVMTYGAGADTNPVFLFSKLAIEKQEAPLVRSLSIPKDFLSSLKDHITEAIKLPPSFDTVEKRTKIACQIRDNANKMLGFCNNEFKEQHLQYQGWGTVVANLEEIAQAMQKTEGKFTKAVAAFLPLREGYFTMLDNFGETLELLDRIPLLAPLKPVEQVEKIHSNRSSMEGSLSYITSSTHISRSLLDWISNQGQGKSIDALQHQCYDDLLVFNSEMFEVCVHQIQELLTLVKCDPHQMKELVGIERRLSELEKRLNEAKKIAKEQTDMAQGFLNHRARLTTTHDAATILPELCNSHKQQLMQMLDRQQRLEALQTNFRKSKQEMSTNIHQRLGWVMHIETQISKLDSDLIFHMKTLRILDCNLQLLNQIKACPQVYANMVVEAARRKIFSKKFAQWAGTLVEDSSQLYKVETERRKQFAKMLGEHFLLDTLFKGFEDMPPSFANKPPPCFDEAVPDITVEDIALLKTAVPELEESLNLSLDSSTFPLSLLSKGITESSSHIVLPHSQSSQTEWSAHVEETTNVPCVVTATKNPPFKFTIPESNDSVDYQPALSSLTEVRDTLSPKTTDHEPAMLTKESPSIISSANVTDSSSTDLPLKMQTKMSSDSTSPISSNEFATADFYFEDSMPSPMADSPLGKKEKKKEEGCKSETDMLASLNAELAEKSNLILELEQKLRDRENMLSEIERVSNQKEGSSDGSSTIVAPSELPDQTDSTPNVSAIQSCEETTQSSQTSSQSSELLQKLELELETAKSDLAKVSALLSEAESRKADVQQQCDTTVAEKSSLVDQLEDQVRKMREELEQASSNAQCVEQTKKELEKALSDSSVKCLLLENEVREGGTILLGIKNKLKECRDKLKIDIPSLKENLQELRGAVLDNKTEMNSAVATVMDSVEKEVSLFNSAILAAACAEFNKERITLREEIQRLQDNAEKSVTESTEKLSHLESQKQELAVEMDLKQQHFDKKYEELKRDFEAELKDIQTKHILETELEVDKCRAEVRENIEEAERNVEQFKIRYNELASNFEELKTASERGREELIQSYKEQIEEKERVHKCEREDLTQKFKAELEEKISEHIKQTTELEAKLQAIQDSLKEKSELALAQMKELLTNEHTLVLTEVKGQAEEQRAQLTQLLEQKQLEHAEKLTLLKTHFDMERESLVREINRYKNCEKSDIATQLDYDLLVELQTHSGTQTELEAVSETLTHSETQTGIELLAEVISLTSSASYGSEEMIAHKIPALCPDEKDRDSLEVNKALPGVEDLNIQLAKAQEKISALDKEVSSLRKENQEVTSKMDQMEEEKRLMFFSEGKLTESQMLGVEHPRYQDFMQTSNTAASIMVMERELSFETNTVESDVVKAKDQKIALLEKKLMEMSMTTKETKDKEMASDNKVSIRGCDKGDLVLLCLDERHDQYVVFTVGTNLHFLHSESLEGLGLRTGTDMACRKSWILAEVVDKEYCLAKKPNNRFRVPQGTCFYRVKCKPWKSEIELLKQDKDITRQVKSVKHDPASGTRPKKDKKQP
ncbi:RB1-inducible coiled-coil protein 1-like [Physella acuta]|uniref:RB1-inducible coiled-coil protein 1-like n=1 Tax=Physella acuta TaxID=109671 RepID=UPI0027DD4C7E|nr:RB1-inducible coiled-coil protein 1-like [Physella acuta]